MTNIELPKCYLDLIHKKNGFILDNGMKIYGSDEIEERNETFEIQEYFPGYVAVGDDSGGMLFLMKASKDSCCVYMKDCGDPFLDENEDKKVEDFINWVENGCEIDQKEDDTSGSDLCEVILTEMPAGGLKELLQIKKAYHCTTSDCELLQGARNAPFVIIENITIAKAQVITRKIGHSAKYIRTERKGPKG